MEIVDKKTVILNRIFYFVLFTIIAISVILTFIKIVINKDYIITAEVSCEPTTEQCFMWECDPEVDDVCSDNSEENISYYKIINKKASDIAKCEATIEKIGCGEELSCVEEETSCFYTYDTSI
ncbi:MAG: hypothetical protein WCW47_00330 [Candidatus Paceibacterota bacterium]|jgi:hypothetical protein